MIYLQTNKKFADSLSAELAAAGLPVSYGFGTRRTVNGNIEKGHPRAFTIDVSESRRADVQAVLDAHVPNFGHVAKKTNKVKVEARRRIDAVAPVWKQVNTARENPSDPMFKKIDAIRDKSELIEAHLATLTDSEAGEYDIENSPLWD